MAVVNPTDRPKSFRNRNFWLRFCVAFLYFSVDKSAFVTELSHISSFFIVYNFGFIFQYLCDFCLIPYLTKGHKRLLFTDDIGLQNPTT